ncbi:MAG: Ig-like domain-containing protein, partial [Paludibacteraceae bacterium]|nr:Ig-like domain-containing protein [Paludibacteraceae bacterium]
LYIFLGAAESVTLDWGAQKVTDDVAVYVNGTFVKNIGKNNNSAIPLTGGNNMVALYSLQTSGDIYLNGLTVVAYVPTTGVALTEGEDAISSKTIWAGTNFTLTATVTPDNASDKTITWTSSDDAIATVVNGVVTGVAANATPATITATTVDGVSATCVVTVTAAPTPSVEPTIITQPAGANYYEDATIAALEVVATGLGDLSYQWYLGSDEIDGATAATYTPTVSAIGSYVYHCVVTHTEAGHLPTSVASNNATITIAEDPAAIKLLDGATVNHTNFITGVTADETIEFKGNEVHYAKFTGTVSGVNGVKDLTRVIAYNATTNKTKIQISAHNNSTNARNILVKGLVEGASEVVDLVTIALGNKEDKISDWIEFNNAANRTIYIFVPSSAGDVYFTQVKVIESGETQMKMAGEAGYSLNFNKGRFFGVKGVTAHFEGLDVKVASSDCAPLSTEVVKLNNTSMSFTVATPLTLTVTTNNNKTYYVTEGAAGTDNETAKTGATDFDLTAGTWYITGGASNVEITNIAFSAPKCEQPQFNALANSDICSGESYVALDGTGTITDGGTVTYKWYAEGGTDVLCTDATYMPTADGSYYVVATNSLAGYTDNVVQSEVITVTTHTRTVISEGLVNQRGVVDDVVTLTVTASGKDLHYTWKECATIGGTYTDVAGAADAASLDVTITEGLNKYYKVIVHSDCGADQESIAKVEQFVPVLQQNVTGSTVWDWTKAASVNEIKLTDATTPKKNEGFVMANGAATVYNNANFESDKLYLEGEYIIRTEGGKLFQGQTIKFNTTVAGAVRVTFSHTGSDKPARELFINGVGTGTSVTGTSQTETGLIEVPAGEVAITAFHVNPTDGAGQQYVRVYKIEFLAVGYTRDNLNPTNIATICLPNGGIMTGATLYKMAGKNEYNKLCFDEVQDNIMVAGNPYLFVPENGNTKINVYYTDKLNVAAGNDNGLYGTYVRLSTVDDGQNSLLWGKYIISNNKYIYVDANNCNLAANRAYIVLNEVQPLQEQNPAPGLRRIVLGTNESQVATGVDQVQGDEVPTKMIINGQLFILRGEKMYDAQGKLVK